MPCRWKAHALLSAGVALIVLCAGCSMQEPSPAARGRIQHEYVDPTGDDASLRLRLYRDGRFDLLRRPRDGRHELVCEGRWERDVTRVLLSTEEWDAVFQEGRTDVTLPIGSDRMPCLNWVSGTEGAIVESLQFLSRPEFYELAHPREGSGTSPGG